MSYSAIDAYSTICELLGDTPIPDDADESEANAATVDAVEARFTAARAMLAALKNVIVHCSPPVTRAEQECYLDAMAGIAQAKAAGIKVQS